MSGGACWYVARGKQQAGPFSDEQLRAHAERGDLQHDDQVWRPGFDGWYRAGDVAGLLRPPVIQKGSTLPPLPTAQPPSPSPPPLPKGPSPETRAEIAGACADAKLVGVRGWLLLLCIHLTIIAPLMNMHAVGRAYQELKPLFSMAPGLERYFITLLVLSAVLTLAGITIGVMLWSRRAGAHGMARWYLLSGLAIGCASPFSIYLFLDMPAGAAWEIIRNFGSPRFVGAAAAALAWYFYLLRSKRVRVNFDSATRVAPISVTQDSGSEQLQSEPPSANKRVAWVAPLVLATFFGFYHTCTRNSRVDPPSSLAESPPPALAPWVAPTAQKPAAADYETDEKQTRFDAEKIPTLLNKVPPSVAPQSRNQHRAEVALLKMIIANRLQECWRMPAWHGSERPIVTLRWRLAADGQLDSDPLVLEPRDDTTFRIAAAAAIRAVRECAPFVLPPDKHKLWRTITWEFDPSQLADAQDSKATKRDLSAELRALGESPAQKLERDGYFEDLEKRFGPGAEEPWRRIALPEGIALEIPVNWIVTGSRKRDAIDAIGKTLQPSSTLKGRMGFGATLHASGGKVVLAQAGIRYYVDSAADNVFQRDIETATPEEIRQLDANLRKGNELSGLRPTLWLGTQRAKTGAFSSLVTEYVARFAHESFDRRFVRVRVYDGKLSFSLLLNYEERSGSPLRVTIDRIINSLSRAN